MRKGIIKYTGVFTMMILLTACGNEQSVVDKVLEQQATEKISDTKTEKKDTSDKEKQDDVTEAETEKTLNVNDEGGQIDVDLTTLSSTMVYSEVYNMMATPEDYVGKKIKMNGSFAVYEDQETEQIYYACIISDATSCCAQGIEFVRAGEFSYPDDYPELGDDITVTGTFETYEEDGALYCNLVGAVME